LSACDNGNCELDVTLQDGGADIVLTASNPLSTQDDVAAALVNQFEIPTFAIKGEDKVTYFKHIRAALEHKPHMTMDDGADLVSSLFFIEMDVSIISSLLWLHGQKVFLMLNAVSC